jgi:hypothetical protein
MNVTELAGYLAAVLVFLTFYMKTMVPLRVVGICSNCIFITYAYLGGLHPVLILHLILLPLNALRLREMLRLVRQVRGAAQGEFNMDWLKPFTHARRFTSGDVLFRKGDVADAMYFVVSGWPKSERISLQGKSSASSACWPRINRARKRCNAAKVAKCCKLPMSRSNSFTTKIRNSDFISCSLPPDGCSKISRCWNGTWLRARPPWFRSSNVLLERH